MVAKTMKGYVLGAFFGVAMFLASAPAAFAQNVAAFGATPLTEFTPGQLYLNTFEGFLYDNANTPPADHDADGRAFAAQVQPRDPAGNPSPAGKVVVIGLGMSNWTAELCGQFGRRAGRCPPFTFMGMAAGDSRVKQTSLVLLDCARGGQDARRWLDDSFGNYSQCLNDLLAPNGLTERQVQVILWKNADALGGGRHASLTAAPGEAPPAFCTSAARAYTEACVYERHLSHVTRYAKVRYPNLMQMFLHTRIAAAYAVTRLNPEPYAYEYGFANKWFVAAQIQQRRGGRIAPIAGDLSYSVAPWVGWGPYFWGSGATPRRDGLVWLPPDFQRDYTHPAAGGIEKVGRMMMDFYLTSPYSPWFRAGGQ